MRERRVTDQRDELCELRRRLRVSKERERTAFDRGFRSALAMMEHGADLEQIRAAGGAVSDLAQSTRDMIPVVITDAESPTVPMRLFRAEDL